MGHTYLYALLTHAIYGKCQINNYYNSLVTEQDATADQ